MGSTSCCYAWRPAAARPSTSRPSCADLARPQALRPGVFFCPRLDLERLDLELLDLELLDLELLDLELLDLELLDLELLDLELLDQAQLDQAQLDQAQLDLELLDLELLDLELLDLELLDLELLDLELLDLELRDPPGGLVSAPARRPPWSCRRPGRPAWAVPAALPAAAPDALRLGRVPRPVRPGPCAVYRVAWCVELVLGAVGRGPWAVRVCHPGRSVFVIPWSILWANSLGQLRPNCSKIDNSLTAVRDSLTGCRMPGPRAVNRGPRAGYAGPQKTGAFSSFLSFSSISDERCGPKSFWGKDPPPRGRSKKGPG